MPSSKDVLQNKKSDYFVNLLFHETEDKLHVGGRAIKTKKVGSPKSFSRWLLSSRTAGGQHVRKSLFSFPPISSPYLRSGHFSSENEGDTFGGGNSLDLPNVSGEVLSHHRLLFFPPPPSFINNSGLCLLVGGLSRRGGGPGPMNARVQCAEACGAMIAVLFGFDFFCFDCVPPFGADFTA